ncbi:MAG: hypothetical protein HDS89_00430 [Bacteroidales bacterium]|nr:hypothetical protein [Bacteroidales bacterium]
MKFANLRSYKQFLGPAACIGVLLMGAACANIGNPSGGARDEDPPIFVSANPPQGSLNVDKTKITLTFNELVNVKDAFTKVVVSPPSRQVPRVTSMGKRVNVTFDSLAPNTTYTIDFADAIEDNNEANKLRGFAYTFSTGDEIDTLRISGMVLDARNLEPRQGILVGVHDNLNDTAFTKTPFLRVAKTDDKGQFSIRGLKAGTYRVFALDDKDNDYKYANPEEDMAFYEVTVSPTAECTETADTIYNELTAEVDTVVPRMRTRYLPNDILLRTFNSQIRPQYLTKYERIDTTRVFFKFNTRAKSLPELNVVLPDGESLSDAVIERNLTNDSLVYWLPERLVHTDSIRIAASYLRTDSTGGLSLTTDSLRFFYNRPKPKKAKKSDLKKKISVQDSISAITLSVKFGSTTQEVYQPIDIEFATPLSKLDTSAFKLETMVDSVWLPVKGDYKLAQRDSVSPRHFRIEYPWDYDTKYRLVADTMAAIGIYGKPTRPIDHTFTTKKEEEYCSLTLHISGEDPEIPGFVELLNSSDGVVRAEPVRNNTVIFRYLPPGKYYARYIEDFNGNGEFDTGNYDIQLQPDLSYYYPKMINIKKNWDKEEQWDLFAEAIDKMKPEAIKKNKPEADKRNRNQNNNYYEEEEDEPFDPTANPFDPNTRNRRKTGAY